MQWTRWAKLCAYLRPHWRSLVSTFNTCGFSASVRFPSLAPQTCFLAATMPTQRTTVMPTKAMKYAVQVLFFSVHSWGMTLSATVLFQFKPGSHRGLEERQPGGKKARAGQ